MKTINYQKLKSIKAIAERLKKDLLIELDLLE